MYLAYIRPYYVLRSRIKWFNRRMYLLCLFSFALWYYDCLPEKLFQDSTSTVLLDNKGQLLGAHISDDEQWRFPECDSVPEKFKTCIIEFEDRRFFDHAGVSIKGMIRAVYQNISTGKRVSGGSTITMQLVRLMRKNPPRTYSEKLLEIVLATRIELSYSKDEILKLYSSHAPFGNNVVGLDAASWRFFGRPSHQLSWSESATLAVLPNAPGLIYPGKNHERLREKRNRLLKRLLDIGKLDELEYETAIMEPLPDRPLALPRLAPHLMNRLISNGKKGLTIHTTLNGQLQDQVNQTLENHMQLLRENKIFNAAVMITSVETGEIIAYVGNSTGSGSEHANRVDCITARRSTGSILKPFLYAKAQESGQITPGMLLVDIPSKFGGFSPKNYAGNFDGLIHADQALSRSLNIPMVHLLNRYGITKFHSDLRDLGFSTLDKPASHYGLSLILGGAEVTLFDLGNVYTRMAQKLQYGQSKSISFDPTVVLQPNLDDLKIDRACIYSTFDAMLEVNRPDAENNWQLFSSSQKIAWKTGTSFGFRDAWAVGVTPKYVVSVWVGNADGEGRPGLTGVTAAAPILFDVFNDLPKAKSWFRKPFDRFKEVKICRQSGHRASLHCPESELKSVPKTVLESNGCPYHQLIHLDQSESFRVDSDCEIPDNMVHKPWFIVPASIEKFYRTNHPEYKSLPSYRSNCTSRLNDHSLAIIYPRNNQRVYLPVDLNEQKTHVIFEASCSRASKTLFWHLDDQFYGQTTELHQLKFQPEVGKHKLTIVSEDGNTTSKYFEVIDK